jgi:hypothetical protein
LFKIAREKKSTLQLRRTCLHPVIAYTCCPFFIRLCCRAATRRSLPWRSRPPVRSPSSGQHRDPTRILLGEAARAPTRCLTRRRPAPATQRSRRPPSPATARPGASARAVPRVLTSHLSRRKKEHLLGPDRGVPAATADRRPGKAGRVLVFGWTHEQGRALMGSIVIVISECAVCLCRWICLGGF